MEEFDVLALVMSGLFLLVGVLVLFVTVDEGSLQKTKQFGPMATLFRYVWWKYFVVMILLVMSGFTFAIYMGWLA